MKKISYKSLAYITNFFNRNRKSKVTRTVDIENLLGRKEIELNTQEIAQYLKDETVLVTGGGGSIGSELCRQIAKYSPKKLLILDIYENNAFNLQNELLFKYKDKIDIHLIIASIRDKERLDKVFSEYTPSVVFHAAAHKHVPLMENNPNEAIKNNVFGTLNVAECSSQYNCKRFILISTDKAVNPTSIMGATKRAAELIIQFMDKKSSTRFAAVRFGNVLGSSGSVIPTFMKQIEHRGPITITHPEITRYFMTIPEASSLVIQAGAMAKGGEIFVLDMGKPIKILDLAKALITQSGLKPNIDIPIEIIGLRPGEKLYEELLLTETGINITKNDKIFVEKSLNIDLSVFMSEINNLRNIDIQSIDEIKRLLKEICIINLK